MRRTPKILKTRSLSVGHGDGAIPNIPAGIHQEPLRADVVAATRNRALLQTASEAIQYLDEQGLLTVQSVLQHGDMYGYWRTPRKWLPTEHSAARMNIDLRKRIVHFLPEQERHLVLDAETQITPVQCGEETGGSLLLVTNSSRVRRILDGAVLTLSRYLTLLRMGPAGIGVKAKNTSLDPTNVRNIGYSYMPQLLALGVRKQLDGISDEKFGDFGATGDTPLQIGYLRLIRAGDLDQINESSKKFIDIEIRRMRVLAERGHWNDVPAIGDVAIGITNIAGPAKPVPEQTTRDAHLPLPDDYVSEMGSRSLWLIQDLAPNILTIADEIKSIWQRTEDATVKPGNVGGRRGTRLSKFLSCYVWRDRQGRIIDAPPFSLRLTQRGKNSNVSKNDAKAQFVVPLTVDHEYDADITGNSESDPGGEESMVKMEWPPRTFGDIMGLMHNVQLAHFFVVALSTGSRRSEALNLKRWCVQYASDNMPYASGRTFKLVQRHDGEPRDWVLPDMAVQAIEQQVRLIKVAEEIDPMHTGDFPLGDPQSEGAATHLWGQIYGSATSNRSTPLVDLGRALSGYARAIGMDLTPGGQNLRPHRFRKTVARLVALALTQAPKILMHVFGHKSIEMTLYYILTDESLQVEIEQVSRELRVMRAKEVVEKMFHDEETQTSELPLAGYGGPAALMVDRAIDVQKGRLHQMGKEWGADSALELAEILTLQGKAWQLVRRGVICTKFPGTESGSCNKSKGHPEPSRCQTHCKHRLEEAFLREDVDGAIQDALTAYIKADESGEDLTREFWAGQIRIHIDRFEDLKAKWQSDTTIRRLVEAPDTQGTPP